MIANFYTTIEDSLENLHEDYKSKVAILGRREADWSLCSARIFTEVELRDIYANATGLPIFDEDNAEEEVDEPERWIEISIEFLQQQCCIPVEQSSGIMTLLICDPYKIKEHRGMFFQLWGIRLDFILARRSTIERLIDEVYKEKDIALDENPNEDVETLRALAEEAKVVRLVNEMFNQAVERRASDIHVEPEDKTLVIRFRIDGELVEYQSFPKSDYPAVASRIKLISGLNIAESRIPQDGRTQYTIGRSDMDLRVSTLPTMNGESIVLRLLKKDSISFDLHDVGMLPEMQEEFDKLISIPHGIILVVGPTGSGKTTTLYSVITKLNDHKRKIITIEDPVEYRLAGLSQMQVNEKIGVTFSSGLRSIVRQDPDIILVGEIRDRETADIAINAALTGHLVFSTLHTNDAAGAVSRLLDMGVQSFLLASALYGVLSQRLVRKCCMRCGEYEGKCRECGDSGLRGRTGIFELMVVNDEIRRGINASNTNKEIEELARKAGMTGILEDGMTKVRMGVTTESEIRRSAAEV